MRIYSSYFGCTTRPNWLLQVSIARFTPRYFGGKRFLTLAPDKDTLKLPFEDFKAAYQHKLSGLDPVIVLKQLSELADGRDILIVGYNKNPEEDTRGLLKDWFAKIGVTITELETGHPDNEFSQMTLDF